MQPTVMTQVLNQVQSHQHRVAFFTGLETNIEEMPPGQRAKMSNVITNVGGAYDQHNGQFCAPVDGVIMQPTVMTQVLNQVQSHQHRVAFFTGLETNIEEMPPGQRAKMSNVITNVGGAYDQHNGQFCAPVDGIYSFIVAISAQGDKQVNIAT
nr:hypothetical transcript [Hymenolepis microstoma]